MAKPDLHLQGMEDIITCSICQELFTDARTLSCKHCFCLACLQDFQTTIVNKPCPLCREETVPPARELHRLPVNRAVNDMVGLIMKHKGEDLDRPPLPTHIIVVVTVWDAVCNIRLCRASVHQLLHKLS